MEQEDPNAEYLKNALMLGESTKNIPIQPPFQRA
jgi:hypothetical protein